jgi:phosphopantetheinyl transferase
MARGGPTTRLAIPKIAPGELVAWLGAHVLAFEQERAWTQLPEPGRVRRARVARASALSPKEQRARLKVPRPAAPSWLSAREAALYGAFSYEHRAREWLAGRGTAKALLLHLHGLDPRDVEILPEDSGAPAVHVRGKREKGLVLNLTHTTLYAAAAVSSRPVGVDLCDLEDGHRIRNIARRVFSEGEAEATGALKDPERGAFVWALKEAGLKVDIGGIFNPGARAIRVLSLYPPALANAGLEVGSWRLPGSALAVAVRRAR